MVEDDKGLMTSELAVANIDVPLFHFSGIAGLTAVNQGDPRCVGGDGKTDSIVSVLWLHSHGGHDQHFVGIDDSGLMSFAAIHHDTVFPSFHNPEVKVRIYLIAG